MKPLLERPTLYLITKGKLGPANFSYKRSELLKTVETAVQAGVGLVQIREKQIEARLLFELVRDAVRIASQSETRILVNERFDIAIAAEAHGVHLPARAVKASIVRGLVPDSFLIGVSAHNLDEVRDAIADGADFATFGPVFDSPGKGRPLGIQELGEICAAFHNFPLLALGGVSETNIESVFNAGAAGVAAIRMLNDPASLVRIAAGVKSRKFR